MFSYFFLFKFQTPVTLCSDELWSILVVRQAHSADLRSQLRHATVKKKRFDPRSRSFSLSSMSIFSSPSSMSIFSSPSSMSIFISSRCSFSCHSLLCLVPVRPGCLFRLFLSPLSPSSQPPIDRVSPNLALKLVTKPILLNRPSGLSD